MTAREFKGMVAFFGIATLLLVTVPAIPTVLGGVLSPLIYPEPASSVARFSANLLAVWHLALLWVCAASGLAILPLAFAPEREKSTLGFILLSPMRPLSIALGKLVSHLIVSAQIPAAIALWSLALTLIFGPAIGMGATIRVWAGVILTGSAVLLGGAAICLGVAALFTRQVSQAGCGVLLALVLIQLPVQLMIISVRPGRLSVLGLLAESIDLPLCWRLLLALCALVTVIGVLAAAWGVQRMRKGDIGFESTKQAA